MLMERVNARSLHEVWHELSWLKKGLLVQNIVGYMSQIFSIQLSRIGSLYLQDDSALSPTTTAIEVGEVVQPAFFQSDDITLDIV